MKTILSTAIIFASSIALASADVVAKSHEEVGKQTAVVMSAMMTGMGKITDKASAEAFAATMPGTKAKMKALLKAAQALPAPTDAEKTAVNKTMDEAQEKAAPAMMAMMAGLVQNPEAEAIGMVLAGVMEDEEMNEVGQALEKMYAQDDKEAAPAPAPSIE